VFFGIGSMVLLILMIVARPGVFQQDLERSGV
jgi:hypothetical protein